MIDLLHAMWQADGTFPSGAFAFSNGLEGLATLGASAPLADLLHEIIALRWATADRVALARSHRAADDLAAVADADAALEAATLAAPLREGSRRNGAALLVTHARLGTPRAADLRDACRTGICLGHLAVMQGALFQALGLDLSAAIAAAGYAAASACVTASVRLGLVGAIEGQRALARALPLLADLAAAPPAPDAPIGGFLPLLDVAACRHARAGLRLFAS